MGPVSGRRNIGVPVVFFDTTLRDGEQSPGSSLNPSEKLEVAHQLVRLGVDVIEAGFPASSPGDFEAVQAIARQVKGAAICGLARCTESDIRTCWEAIKDAQRPRIHTFVSTSDIHLQHQMHASREDVVALTRAMVELSVALCPGDVEFSAMDATRSDVDFLAQVLETAIQAGATTINVPDTVGYSLPTEYAALMDQLYEKVPSLDKVVLSVHCHNDLGVATANSLAAVERGATQVEVAINGLGERGRQRGAGRDRHGPGHAARHTAAPLQHRHHRDRPGQSHDLELHGPCGAGQQGHRGQERLRARVGHTPGRSA
jgi:2-isopropylmalate synthase